MLDGIVQAGLNDRDKSQDVVVRLRSFDAQARGILFRQIPVLCPPIILRVDILIVIADLSLLNNEYM